MDRPSIEDVKNRYENKLLSQEGVVGIGIGEGANEELCIKVYVKRKSSRVEEAIPKRLEDYTVEIEEIGEVEAL